MWPFKDRVVIARDHPTGWEPDDTWHLVSAYSFPPFDRAVEYMRREWTGSSFLRWCDLPPEMNAANLYWREP